MANQTLKLSIRILLPVILLFSSGRTRADDWPGFRGPAFNGSNEETGLPSRFTKTENVRWRAKLSGPGSSTPAVWGNAVFLTSVDRKEGGILASKIALDSGEIVWSRRLCDESGRDRLSDFSAPSPATDGEVVVFLSGNGDLAGFSFDGEERWRRNLQEDFGRFAQKWTFSSSPVLFRETLYVQVLQQNETIDGEIPGADSYLLALNPETGEEKWRVTRESPAVGESREAYSTPLPVIHAGREEIVVSGADRLTGHDPATGTELWHWGTWNRNRISHWRVVSSPVYGRGVILGCAPKGGPGFAVFAGGKGTMKITRTRWVTRKKEVSCDVTTPLLYRDRFYLLNGRKGILSCLDPVSGGVYWSRQLDVRGKIEASPTAADGKIYLISHLGEVFVVRAADEFELLHATVLGEDNEARNRASIVPARGCLLIRVGDQLWCVRKTDE